MEIKRNRINNYFYNLSLQLLIPKGYHQLKVYRNNLLFFIDLNCITELKGVNKLIPYICNNFFEIDKNISLILRQGEEINDFILHDFHFNEIEVKLIYKMIINYLNPLIIPTDLLKLILNYLNGNDYINLLESLNFYNYESLLKDLTNRRVIMSDGIPVFKDQQIKREENVNFKL